MSVYTYIYICIYIYVHKCTGTFLVLLYDYIPPISLHCVHCVGLHRFLGWRVLAMILGRGVGWYQYLMVLSGSLVTLVYEHEHEDESEAESLPKTTVNENPIHALNPQTREPN